MPRDRGGIGRTGNKPKKSAAKRAAAAEATADNVSPTSPTSAEAAPTNKEEEEGLEIVGPFSPSVTKQVKKFKSKMKKVSWAPLPRVEHGRRTKRLTNGWTWGGHFDRPWSYYDTFPDGSKCGLDNPWDGQALKMERVALGAVLRAHRMAEDVATGGTKEWVWTRRIQWRLDVKQRPFRSHRDWCPDADPDPHFFGHGRVKIR